jgi:hypothetical protein
LIGSGSAFCLGQIFDLGDAQYIHNIDISIINMYVCGHSEGMSPILLFQDSYEKTIFSHFSLVLLKIKTGW